MKYGPPDPNGVDDLGMGDAKRIRLATAMPHQDWVPLEWKDKPCSATDMLIMLRD